MIGALSPWRLVPIVGDPSATRRGQHRSARRRFTVALRAGRSVAPRRHPGGGVRVHACRPGHDPGPDRRARRDRRAGSRRPPSRSPPTAPAGTGFVTVYPAGTPRPETSILNLQAGRDTANSGIVPVSADGAIDVYANVADRPHRRRHRHVHPDIVRHRRPVRARRPDPAARHAGGRAARRSRQAARSPSPLPSGVSADATAVAVNVTSVGAPTAGFFSAFPVGLGGSNASFMNPDGSGAPRAAHVIVPVSPGGFTIATTSGGHVIVDLVGWFTGPSARELRRPGCSCRRRRPASSTPAATSHGSGEAGRASSASLIPDAAAIVTNVTITRSDDAGFVTAYPAGTDLPTTSTVNATTRDDAVPNLAITRRRAARHRVLLRPRHRPDRRHHRLLHRHARRVAAAGAGQRPSTVAAC